MILTHALTKFANKIVDSINRGVSDATAQILDNSKALQLKDELSEAKRDIGIDLAGTILTPSSL